MWQEILLNYYLESHNVWSLYEIKELLTVDGLKEAMEENMQTYVVQREISQWLRPRETVMLAVTFEESLQNSIARRRGLGSKKEG